MIKNRMSRLLHSKEGKIIFSIILGIGLASLFRRACTSRKCLVFKAPSMNAIKGKIFGHGDKCYEFKPHSTNCSTVTTDKNIVVSR